MKKRANKIDYTTDLQTRLISLKKDYEMHLQLFECSRYSGDKLRAALLTLIKDGIPQTRIAEILSVSNSLVSKLKKSALQKGGDSK